eukprot:Amastigsp_a341840_7.p3 type:complete len:107 gc:universal Amastigsp_a341840_7:337-17(-)
MSATTIRRSSRSKTSPTFASKVFSAPASIATTRSGFLSTRTRVRSPWFPSRTTTDSAVAAISAAAAARFRRITSRMIVKTRRATITELARTSADALAAMDKRGGPS